MKVADAVNYGINFLRSRGVSSAQIEAELLWSFAMQEDRATLYKNLFNQISEDKLEIYNKLLERRSNSEPIQYIIGSIEFYGRNFKVTKDVLIPRPETELIIDELKQHFKSDRRFTLLDIGTGSGNIAITVKKEFPLAVVFALDISFPALKIAMLNAESNGVKGEGVYLFSSDLMSAIRPGVKFDAIVSNPPYIPSDRIEFLQPEIKFYEPGIAIDGGTEGLEKIEKIIFSAGAFLKSGGLLIVEIDSSQSEKVLSLLDKTEYYVNYTIKKDLSGLDRILVATGK